jgi:hypothetical protein
MKWFGLSLFLLNLFAAVYLLPVQAQLVAEKPVKQIQILDLSAPHMYALLRLIEVEYSMRLGTGPYISFPEDTTVIVLSGELGKIYMDGCGCLGQVWNFAPHTAIVISDSGKANPEEILVHELIHVLQAVDGRIFNRMPSELAEHEAYLLGDHIIVTLNLLRDHRGL